MLKSASRKPTLYYGQFPRGLDDSRRVMFPSEWRSSLGKMEFTVIRWPIAMEDYLLVLPPERWAALLDNLKKQSLSNEKVAALERVIGSTSSLLTLDKVGRIRLSEELTKPVGIDREVLFVGRVDKFEIWHPAKCAKVSSADKKLAAEVFNQITL